MARSEIPMVINLRQNKNDESTAYGKYFAEVDSKEPLNLKGLAKHMTEHGKISSLEMCQLVLGELVNCLVHLLREGQPVKLDGFGTFSPSVDGQKLGKANLADAVAGGPEGRETHLKGAEGGVRVHLRVSRGERETHRRRQGEAIPEEDAADLRAGSYG